jgi:hypothetical protein
MARNVKVLLRYERNHNRKNSKKINSQVHADVAK